MQYKPAKGSSKKVRLCVYIGRFSPFHNGHAEVLRRASSTYNHVLVLIGSVFKARNPKNPWTGPERAQMVLSWGAEHGFDNIKIELARDFPYNDQLWIANIQRLVREEIEQLQRSTYSLSTEFEVVVTGADRDSSTFYLKYFPDWSLDLTEENRSVSLALSATSVREVFFGQRFDGVDIAPKSAELLLRSFLPPTTVELLALFEGTSEYQELKSEHEFNIKYREPYNALPYGVIFHTVDALVVQAGHVLLVRRRHRPGKGLWALPGGFLEQNERLVDGALRELREETAIDVSPGLLKGSIKYHDDFDYPERSLRGRTITTCYLIQLPDFIQDGQVILPKVKAQDDAEKVRWVPIDEVMQNPDMFFEDHFEIIEFLLNKLEK